MPWIKDELTPEGQRIEKVTKDLANHKVKIGFQAGAGAEPNGTDICEVASYQEYGTSTIPPRPFLRMTTVDHQDEIDAQAGIALDLIAAGESAEGILKRLGVQGKGLVKQEIIDGNFAPNAPSTIKKKGSSHPLIDSATMLGAVNFKIE